MLCIHLLFIIYSVIFVLKYLGYFQYNYHCIKVWDVLENHCYPPITPTHFLEWISLQYYDITIRIMWVHSNLPWLLTLALIINFVGSAHNQWRIGIMVLPGFSLLLRSKSPLSSFLVCSAWHLYHFPSSFMVYHIHLLKQAFSLSKGWYKP